MGEVLIAMLSDGDAVIAMSLDGDAVIEMADINRHHWTSLDITGHYTVPTPKQPSNHINFRFEQYV
jgi:hypothetical protein